MIWSLDVDAKLTTWMEDLIYIASAPCVWKGQMIHVISIRIDYKTRDVIGDIKMTHVCVKQNRQHKT